MVTITGYVERSVFEDYVAAADICLNLRHPTAGETSASLLRLLGAGKPTLVTASGAFCALPPDVAAQVDPDASEGDLLIAYCDLLLTQPAIAAALGANARAFVAHNHTLEAAAEGYARFLSSRYGWGDMQKVRPPLWAVEEQGAGEPRSHGATEPRSHGATEPRSHGEGEVPRMLHGGVAQALIELGATEDDTPLLLATAQALHEIGD